MLNVLTVAKGGTVTSYTDEQLLDRILARAGVTLFLRLRMRQAGLYRRWLDQERSSIDEMLAVIDDDARGFDGRVRHTA